ncbi:odorant receptor 4-like [Anoplophora glabripennis]|uniref:odorant receptor 4-like n=1 Tax=Anoplophora glabripennis TaxID=217634 RepID=UPI000873AF9E|nr:odorant receptor 4-like [Anoplophora glabripennis]
MKMKRHIDLLKFIKEERTCMVFGGFYSIEKYKVLHNLSAILIMTVVSLYNLLGLVHGFQHISNVAVFSQSIAYLLTGISFSCKMINLIMHKNNLLLLDEILQNPIFTELETTEEEVVLKNTLKFGQTLKKTYKLYTSATVTVQVLYPMINNPGHKNFPLLFWFPFNPEDHYYKVYFAEILMIFCICTFNVTVDLLNVLFMDLCAAQFELLKYRLKHFGREFHGGEAVNDRTLYEKLNKIIVHQNLVYRFSKLTEETFSAGVFCHLACTVIVLCCAIFKAVITPINSMQFLMMATYSFCMTLEVSLYCCYGQKVLDSSSTITEACFMANWYNCNVKVQEDLVIIMNRANKFVTMKAGGMFPLTLETLMRIWSSAYSFLTLLMQIYNENY